MVTVSLLNSLTWMLNLKALTGDFAAENLPYKVTLGSDSFKTSESWQLKDASTVMMVNWVLD